LLLGDHGCRSVSRYVVESHTDDPQRFLYYIEMDGSINYRGEHMFTSKGIDCVQFDGGILRIKLSGDLSAEDIEVLSRFGSVYCNHSLENSLEPDYRERYNNSLTPDMYDYTIVANKDLIFCKRNWVTISVLEQLVEHEMLPIGSLPKGEHGTYYNDDLYVPLLSNVPAQKSMNNTMIKDLVESLLYENTVDTDQR